MEDGTINGGEAVVATLLSRGIDTVFFVPGGTYVTVLEALSRVQNKIGKLYGNICCQELLWFKRLARKRILSSSCTSPTM